MIVVAAPDPSTNVGDVGAAGVTVNVDVLVVEPAIT
jgi:hypothetical protein